MTDILKSEPIEELIADLNRRIGDEGMARMDAMKAKYGEDHHLFWLAMQFATESLKQFDARHGPLHPRF